ncbi:unnamed protein product [Rotaria sordida]|uniref:LicD/FKTN/FKRP nucleotidyltransferase domain-containing protein n=1 Tax=Rotaria sordida TaxID=392033 RepID=A0A814F0I6_9BILA|nr:unnamed protein product [Rotaria sordida]
MVKLLQYCNLKLIILFLFGYILINFFASYKSFPKTNNYDKIIHNENGQQSIWTYEMKLFCFKIQQYIDNEKKDKLSNLLFKRNISIISPNLNKYTKQQSREISYYYSNWRSSPDLPRRLTPCDHQLYIELLRILDHFFRRHSISYMMIDGTLLGSYTNHDFLPWDDDVDLRVLMRDRSRMYTLLHQEFEHTIRILNISNEFGRYDILYFPWSPKAGIYNWSYPNVHITYLDENSTHVWREYNDNYSIHDCSISKLDIFPLVWRPFGQIWLPAPREPLVIFELLQWKSFDKLYYAKNYSHKYERAIPFIDGRARLHQLYPYYPWHKSKPRINNGRRTTEEVSTLNDSNHTSINDNDISSSSIHFVEEFVPERYLVLLTEQMTEMLFRLMTCNETSVIMSECGFDHRMSLGISTGSGNISTPSSNSTNGRSSLQLQSMYQSCIKCKRKMLTIEEFRELHS